MKYLKRISTALIACVMMLSMCIPVFASNTITVGNGENKIYIHKIDQTTLEKYLTADIGEGSYIPSSTVNTGEQLSGSAVIGVWKETDSTTHDIRVDDVAAYEESTTLDYGKILLANIPFAITKVAPKADKEGASDVDDYDPVSPEVKAKGVTGTDGVLIFEQLDDGYYLVSEEVNPTSTSTIDDFIIALPYGDPTGSDQESKVVHAYPKNSTYDAPAIDKEIPADSIIGNAISWKIKAEIPASIKEEIGAQEYKITDTINSYLTLDEASITVYYNGASKVLLAEASDYSVSYADNVLPITLLEPGYAKLYNVVNDEAITDKNLYVEYKTLVTLNKDQLAALPTNPITNKAELDFKNNDSNTYHTDKEVQEDGLGGFRIIKQDGSNNSVKLENIEFEIYTAYTDDITNTLLRHKDGSAVILTTDENGEASFYGLGAGTYYIKEVAASVPTGYKALTGVVSVTITSEQAKDQNVVDVKIDNYFDNSFTLPTTGGTGTMLFTIVGIALIAVAGVVFYVSRRKKKARN